MRKSLCSILLPVELWIALKMMYNKAMMKMTAMKLIMEISLAWILIYPKWASYMLLSFDRVGRMSTSVVATLHRAFLNNMSNGDFHTPPVNFMEFGLRTTCRATCKCYILATRPQPFSNDINNNSVVVTIIMITKTLMITITIIMITMTIWNFDSRSQW